MYTTIFDREVNALINQILLKVIYGLYTNTFNAGS